MKSSVTQLVELAPALADVLGADAVHSDDAQLDAYTADTYWPAIAARANGTPLGRPDVVAIPRTEEAVAVALRIAAAHGVPVVAWGGGSGTQGGAVPIHGGLVIDLRGARPDRRDRRALADGHGAGGRQRPRTRARAQRARVDAPPLPGVVGVGDGRRLHRGARVRRPLHPLRQDRGSGAVPAGRAARRRADRHGLGPAARRRPGPDAAVRRLRGHARDHHARDARGRPAAGRAAVRDARVRDRRRRRRGLPRTRSPPATARR